MKVKIDSATLTTRITGGAKAWMLGAGFKPVEEEVPASSGWVADLAGYVYPTRTELKTRLKLHKMIEAPPYTPEDEKLTIFYAKYEMPLTAICEVKVTAADFKKDVGRKFNRTQRIHHPGHLAYLAFPKGMVDEMELPWYWGHLVFSADGQRLLKARQPMRITAQNPHETIQLISDIGMRCFNKWWYREMREMIKKCNANDTEDKQRWRLNELLSLFVEHFDSDKVHKTDWLRERHARTFAEKIADSTNRKLTRDQVTLCEQIDLLAVRPGMEMIDA